MLHSSFGWPRGYESEVAVDPDIPSKPVGHEEIATGNVKSCKEFWRSFVRSPVSIDWIENGYPLLCTVAPPPAKEMANASSASEHGEFPLG